MLRRTRIIICSISVVVVGLLFIVWLFIPKKPVPLTPTITMEAVKEGAEYPDKVKYDKATGNYKYYYPYSKEKYWVFEPGTKIEALIKTEIRFFPNIQKYKYSYQVINSNKSRQKIDSFAVEYGDAIDHVTLPTDRLFIDKMLDEQMVFRTIANWGVTIKPGESQNGFSFESKGLPGIVDSYLKGYVPLPPPFPKGGAPGDKPPDFFHNSIAGKTVGPVAVPEKFVPEEFLSNLISLKDESFKLGWIDTRMLSFRLGNRLKAIGKAIDEKNTLMAKDLTQSFIKEVASLKDEHLTPEAYYILKFNAQYLLDHLS